MIILSQENTDVWVKIDKKFKPILQKYKWKINSLGYPTAWIENRQITMSKFIIKLEKIQIPDGHVISYENSNRLDNRIKNLKIIRRNIYKRK
jgi:hypothetical protein